MRAIERIKINKRTAKALDGSIRKWTRIVSGTHEDQGSDDCPLCKIYAGEGVSVSGACDGCPVMEDTGWRGCRGTPYLGTSSHNKDPEDGTNQDMAMLGYLVGLRARCVTPKRNAAPRKEKR